MLATKLMATDPNPQALTWLARLQQAARGLKAMVLMADPEARRLRLSLALIQKP